MLRLSRILPTKFIRGIFVNRSLTICTDGLHQRCLSESKFNDKLGNNFEHLMDHRHCEAKRSIVVQVLSEQSYEDLYSYCSRFGNILSSHYYILDHNKRSTRSNYILLEFEQVASAAAALESSTIRESDTVEHGAPVRSRFLWFASDKNGTKLKPKSTPMKLVTSQVAEVDKEYLHESLQLADSISTQMQILYNKTRLNELAVRLRFMAALQIEEIFSGIYLDTRVYPFGSSVNGFGKLGSDLDLILKPLKDERRHSATHSNIRLFFHEKEAVHGDREAKQMEISALAQMLSVFAPGVENVVPIPKARIPIVKYYQTLLGLHVDLSVSNMSAFYMSELLHIFGQIDDRVRPLVFTVRYWASQLNITSGTGQKLTNFPLTCLVLCFLQRLPQPILPTLGELEQKTRIEDIRVTGNINCTFLRDLSQIEFSTENDANLEELLIEFFKFLAHIDFDKYALSLHSRKLTHKRNSSPMYFENPLERDLNVSKMVTHKERDRIQALAELSLSYLVHRLVPLSATPTKPWGITTFTNGTSINN